MFARIGDALVMALGYPLAAAVIRFFKIVAAAALVAVGSVLTHLLTADQAYTAFTFTVGTAILVAGDKLQREAGKARSVAKTKRALMDTARLERQRRE